MKYREIVTKAVVGKGRKVEISTHLLAPETTPSKALGCWIINHSCTGRYQDGKVFLEGGYDLHLWYAFDDDTLTDVYTTRINYSEEVPMRIKPGETLSAGNELKVYCLKYPVCNQLQLRHDGHLEVQVEKELAVDVIGDAILRVQISDTFEDDFEQEQVLDGINQNYFNPVGR